MYFITTKKGLETLLRAARNVGAISTIGAIGLVIVTTSQEKHPHTPSWIISMMVFAWFSLILGLIFATYAAYWMTIREHYKTINAQTLKNMRIGLRFEYGLHLFLAFIFACLVFMALRLTSMSYGTTIENFKAHHKQPSVTIEVQPPSSSNSTNP